MAKAVALLQSRNRTAAHRRRSFGDASSTSPPVDLQTPFPPTQASAACVPVENFPEAKLSDGSLLSSSGQAVAHRTEPPSAACAMLYLRPLEKMGHVLQLQAFDADYLEALRTGDPQTQEHFVCYFTELLQLKLRSRMRTPQAIEDVRQETFTRVLTTIRKKDGLRQPERLGPFVNTVCNNVMLEYWRQSSRSDSLDEEGTPELPARGVSVLDAAQSRQMEEQVRKILTGLPEHERSLLRAIFIEERDREEVCREFGVDRDYLRVLLHRAKQVFKANYLRQNNGRLPFTSAASEA